MKNTTKIAIIFWTHFAVAIASHIFIVLMTGGVLKLLLTVGPLGIWEKGLILGVTFFTGMYATNHITNSKGFCVLTDLENFYRKKEGIKLVDAFTPRFYRKIGKILSAIKCLFTKYPRKDKE